MSILTAAERITLQALHAPVQVIDAEIATDRLLPGQGFNIATGAQGMLNCVIYRDGNDLQKLDPGTGQHTHLICEAVEDFEELKSKLDVSASATLGVGIYSGKTSASYLNDEKHTRFDSYLLIGVKVLNPALVLKRAHLSPAALRLIRDGISAFLEKCGNSYVYGYITGGEILGIVRYKAVSDEQASEVRLQVDAAAKGVASGNLTMSHAVSSITKQTESKYSIIRDGGAGNLPTPDALIAAANALPDILRNPGNARVVRTLVRGYQTVDNLPHKALDLRILEHQVQALETTATYLSTARLVANDIGIIRRDLARYDLTGDPNQIVTDAAEKIATIISDLEETADRITQDPNTPTPDRPDFPNIPARIRDVPKPPVLELWTDRDGGGKYLPTNVSIPNLQHTPVGDINDQVTCVKVNGSPGEYTVTLFEHADYQGAGVTFTSPCYIDTLDGRWFNGVYIHDLTSSVRIDQKL